MQFFLILLIIILFVTILTVLIYFFFFKKKNNSTPKPVPPKPVPANSEVTNMMGDNTWILMLKLGTGGDNCTRKDRAYSCHFLYASSSQPTLKLVSDYTVDQEDDRNPAYQFFKTCHDPSNSHVSWNDEGSIRSCVGENGAAHDKGALVYNKSMTAGVYLQSSNTNWGFFDNQEFLKSCSKEDCRKKCNTNPDGCLIHPGIQTDLAQHLLFIKIDSAKDLSTMVKLMNNANLCLLEGSIPEFKPVGKGCCPSGLNYMKDTVGSVTIISKPRGERGDDAWSYMNKTSCNKKGMYVYSFCSNPSCPGEIRNSSKISINGITDVTNLHHDNKSSLNLNCGLEFSAFHANHSKIGVCDDSDSDVVIVGGNNHSVATQGSRGGLFVVIFNKTLAAKFRCMFFKNKESFFVSYAVEGPMLVPELGLRAGLPVNHPILGPVKEPSPLNSRSTRGVPPLVLP